MGDPVGACRKSRPGSPSGRARVGIYHAPRLRNIREPSGPLEPHLVRWSRTSGSLGSESDMRPAARGTPPVESVDLNRSNNAQPDSGRNKDANAPEPPAAPGQMDIDGDRCLGPREKGHDRVLRHAANEEAEDAG